MKRSLLLTMVVFATCVRMQAQSIGPSILNSMGGSGTISGQEFEWSVGEMTLVGTFTSPGVVVTQGVLQPGHTYLGVANTKLSDNLKVFPNPAVSVVNLQYTSSGPGTLSYRLADMAGQEIKSASLDITQGTTLEQLSLSGLACATYMLEVAINPNSNSPEIMTYKIEKLN